MRSRWARRAGHEIGWLGSGRAGAHMKRRATQQRGRRSRLDAWRTSLPGGYALRLTEQGRHLVVGEAAELAAAAAAVEHRGLGLVGRHVALLGGRQRSHR